MGPAPRTVALALPLTLVLTLALSSSGEQLACEGVGQGECQVEFLQVASTVRSRRVPSGVQRTWGRSFLSADPAASADYFIRYAGATRMSLPDCSPAERAAVKLYFRGGGVLPQLLFFVKDPLAYVGTWNVTETMLEAAALIQSTFGPGTPLWTPWWDNHDAYAGIDLINLTAALEDKVPMLVYVDSSVKGANLLRTYIPGTLFTTDSWFGASTASLATMQELDQLWLEDCPEKCREGGDLPFSRLGWSKSTYMAAAPQTAANFMVDILDAEQMDSDFPWPPQEGCTAALWVEFPDIDFQVHFVFSQEYQTDGFSIEEQLEEMDGSEALKSGLFHASMYNSLVLVVDSLDKYVLRLQAKSLPYMLVQISSAEYALFMIIPKNAITVQLRSAHVSVEAPISATMCTLDYGGVTK